ncbi:hypothetical protein J2S70_001331 [Trueperella bonasi]|uniref:ATP synthase protein I n=1 Tax=Trueperella bonasi TaxID=312286 RepID=A0ABT9NH64_9ACTO|nr:hypothetical protein [Trueperella bonasi]MDP9806749.1 hypothetical protein [Trueperella bonasi]
MRRRRPGERYSAEGLQARAALAAMLGTGAVTGLGVLIAPVHAESIGAAGAVTVALHLITVGVSVLLARFDVPSAVGIGAYSVKLFVLAGALVYLQGLECMNMRAVLGTLIATIVVSLAITAVILSKGPGPTVGDE